MIYQLKALVTIEGLLVIAIVLFRSCVRPQYRARIAIGDIAAMLLIPPIGLFGHDRNVFYGFLLLMPLTWAGDPARLARRYCLTLVVFPELAQVYTIGGLYLGVWSALFSFNAGALLALAMTPRRSARPIPAIDAAMWGIFLLTLLTLIRGIPVNGALRFAWTTFLLVMAPYLVVSRSTTSLRSMIDTIAFGVFGAVTDAVIAAFESVKHWAVYETISAALNVKAAGTSANLAMRAGLLRAGGALLNYEALGLVLGIGIIATIAIRRHFTRMGFYVVLAALICGLFTSQARSAWSATIVGLVIYLVYQRRWSRAAALIGGVAIAAALLSLVSPSGGKIDQIMGNNDQGESTGQYRQRLATRSIEEARQHPLTGQTLNQLQISMNDLRQGEKIIDFLNTHLLVLLVGGIGALLAWVVAWMTPLVRGWRGRDGGLVAMPAAVTGMIFVFLTFTSPVDRILSVAAIAIALLGAALRLGVVARKPLRPAVGRDQTPSSSPLPGPTAGVVPF